MGRRILLACMGGIRMKKYVNGQYIELTLEEITAMRDAAAQAEAEEKRRPLSYSEVQEMLVRHQINTLTVDDQTALRMLEFYPEWTDLAAEQYSTDKAEYKFQHNGKLYKTIPANHTFQADWVPGVGTESIYVRIDETHDGTKYDPIPYDGNMALESGKYYIQDDVVYLCSRDTVNPVYNALSELVGLYVEVVNG